MKSPKEPEVELANITATTELPSGNRFLIYGTEKGVKIDIRYEGETLWMTQKQMADLFGVGVSAINKHLTNILDEGELISGTTVSKMEIVDPSGRARHTLVYNLDAIISVGYRVSSKQATQFRIWATERLKEILLKGWSIDVQRMKDPSSRDHLRELKETIREIRASEANVYREVRSICAMCQDYSPQSEEWRNFYAGMQNRMLWAVTQMTGPEIIKSRANARLPNMGLTAWANDNIRKHDVSIANNYLAGAEIKQKNRLTTMLLDYFEDQADQGRLVTMAEAEKKLLEFIRFNNRPLLNHLGSVKRDVADRHANSQYDIYKEAQRVLRTHSW